MTQQERERFHEALTDGDPPELKDAIGQLITADIASIEPIVDEMLRQAEARGRFGGMLEMIHNHQEHLKELQEQARRDDESETFMHTHGCMICQIPVPCSCPFPEDIGETYCQEHFPF